MDIVERLQQQATSPLVMTAGQQICREAADEIERLREALLRAKQWGGMGKSWHSGVAMDLMAWIDADMKGPLPPLPNYLPTKEYESEISRKMTVRPCKRCSA